MADPKSPGGFENLLTSIKSQAAYPLEAAVPEVQVSAQRRHPNISASVARDDPSNIKINLAADKHFPQELMHEFEHVLQNNVSKRYDNSYDGEVLKEARKMGLDRHDVVMSLHSAGTSTVLHDRLKELGATPTEYLGKMPAGMISLREQWADLSAIEQQLKKDLTQDPVVRKEMFNDSEKLVQLYKGTTGLRTTRLDAKDLPPMTAGPNITPQGPATLPAPAAPPPSILDRVMQMFQSKPK